MNSYDVVIIGASASGLMCAVEAAKRGRRVAVLDHAVKAAKKIRISGGGKCNFSNYYVSADNYLSQNPHFCKSALSRYQYFDFLALMAEYDIPWHERDHGQLFCDRSAMDIVDMLLAECHRYHADIILGCQIENIARISGDETFLLHTSQKSFTAESLVIATGGLSVPKMGATDFGLKVARQFELNLIPTRPGLVPFTHNKTQLKNLQCLSGIAVEAVVSLDSEEGTKSFRENLLFTHKGLSGPVILQISSYWHKGQSVEINLLPDMDLGHWLTQQQKEHPDSRLKTLLCRLLPRRLVEVLTQKLSVEKPVKQYNFSEIESVSKLFSRWKYTPSGTEGYRVAEVTVGGLDTSELSSKTMQVRKVKGLYFIGEVVDVTGHLGGFNFQWAWASGFCAGQYV